MNSPLVQTDTLPHPEGVYDELLAHAQRCPRCKPWSEELCRAARLCLIGKVLLDLYARTLLVDVAAKAVQAALEADSRPRRVVAR